MSPVEHERRDEYAARLIVEANTDHLLEVIDNGSANNLVDYQIVNTCGRIVGALEVGRNTDSTARRSEDAYRRKASTPRRVDGLTTSWLVMCERDRTKFSGLFERLAPLLHELESTSRTYVDVGRAHPYGGQDRTIDWKLKTLGVLSASSLEPRDDCPEVFVESMSDYVSALGADVAVSEAEKWLDSEQPDQQGARRKLMATGLLERHMFVWVDHYDVQASRGLAEPELPVRTPTLPAEITHLWLAADSGLRGIGGWHWSPERGWIALAEVESSVTKAYTHFPR
ncbi:hypothetical protein IU440_24420 [Nocardia cyriacigeorgica]|uniref:hypothetical protein n=1 Tax=Nocardia cyriacigeorgica TaxID=135487 RepID=UPI001894BF9C|nr:hypothetical protein [Nocardia cyriacigeorgica]MBF6427830.1 hypothetical protein [Nocardia cyriacigeorgica]